MTDKQFSSLRATITGAAFFIGGAITGGNFGTLFMIAGAVLLIKDFVIGLWAETDVDNKTEEKEEPKNDTH
ncbi:MAG: hypothetical protein K2N78_08800 [Oscillospiraceae bacterium]|nr:hypothetical protein [Oscillospiraceae bacterium]